MASQPVPPAYLNTISASIVSLDAGKHNRVGSEIHTGLWVSDGLVGVTQAFVHVYPNELLVRDLAAFNVPGDTLGALKVSFPTTWADTYIHLKLKGYTKDSFAGFELLLSGTQYNSSWVHTGAVAWGSVPFTTATFGHDGVNCCILLGDASTVLNNPAFELTEVMVSSATNSDVWVEGWALSQVVSTTGYLLEPPVTISQVITTTSTGGLTTDHVHEGLANLYFTSVRAITANLTGYSNVIGGAISETDSIMLAIGKLENKIKGLGGNDLPIGALMPFSGSTIPTGYLVCNGDTIGSATSGASFSGINYQEVYYFLWAYAPSLFTSVGIVTPKGTTAAEDWTANKRLSIPDLRNRVIVGAGNTWSSGTLGGESTHTLLTTELPEHTHNIYTENPYSPNYYSWPYGYVGTTGFMGSAAGADLNQGYGLSSPTGGGGSHNNMPPFYAGVWLLLCYYAGAETTPPVSCGSGCSYSCSTTCTGACTGACTGSCTGACTGSCTGACSTVCTGTCTGTCTVACGGNCTGGCTGGCGGGCSTNCTGGCSGSCTAACATGCSGNCETNCTGCGSCSGHL